MSVILLKTTRKLAGYSKVELLLTVSLFTLLVLALLSVLVLGIHKQSQISESAKATFLMDEGLEATSNIYNQGFTRLTLGAHGLSTKEGVWSFSGTHEVIDSYKRVVTITSVDADTVDAEISINWQTALGLSQNIKATERYTNYQQVISSIGWVKPVLKTTMNITGPTGFGLRVGIGANNMAYMIKNTGNPNFTAINFTNPLVPVQAWGLTLSGNPLDIKVAGDFAYVSTTSTSGAIQIIDLKSHKVEATIDILGSANTSMRLYYQNSFLYVITSSPDASESKLKIYNVANPVKPVLVGGLEFPAAIKLNDLVVSGDYAYIATSADNGELAVVDVTTKTAPQYKVGLDLQGNVNGLLLSLHDKSLFMGRDGDSTIYVISIENPVQPILESVYGISGMPTAFSFGPAGTSYLFVATKNTLQDIQVLSIANLTAMNLLGTVDSRYPVVDLAYVPDKNIVIGASSSTSSEFLIFNEKK